MKKSIVFTGLLFLSFGCGAIGSFYYFTHQKTTSQADSLIVRQKLIFSKNTVRFQFRTLEQNLLNQLKALSVIISEDRDFAMKFLVDQDYSASEIADMAAKYIKPMGLSFLEITDSNFIILSSGQLPASTGNISTNKKNLVNEKLYGVFENLKGNEVFSLQLRVAFSIANQTMYCTGGVLVDSSYIRVLNTMAPEGVQIVLQNKRDLLGIIKSVDSISPIDTVNKSIIINNSLWYVEAFRIPCLNSESSIQILFLYDLNKKV